MCEDCGKECEGRHCFGCKARSFRVASKAMPSRTPDAVRNADALEGRWVKDIDGYKQLRKAGLQPDTVDGAGTVVNQATSTEHAAAML